MKLIEQTLINQGTLEVTIQASLLKTAHQTFVASGGKPQEPDFIASLVRDFTPELFVLLQTFYKGINFSLTSVFTHQKPTVDIGMRRNPELGDLLLVLMHTDSRGKKWFNSLLLQAKMSRSERSIIRLADYHQLRLYKEWPEFAYVNSSASLRGKKRTVKPHTIHNGGQYLMIDKSHVASSGHKGHFSMGCAMPDRELLLDKPFHTEIVEFLKFKSGRMFEERHQVTEDWSQVVWDLLDLSAGVFSRRANSRRQSFARQYRTDQMPENLLFFQDHRENRREATNDINEDAAVPVIVIESNENVG